MTKLLPVLDTFDLAHAHLGRDGRPAEVGRRGQGPRARLGAQLLRHPRPRGPRARRTQPGVAFDPTIHDAVAHAGRARRRPGGDGTEPTARAGRRRGAAGRLPLEGPGAPPGHGAGAGADVAAQREWFEKDYYQVLGVASTATDKEITQGLPQAGQAVPPRRQPGIRGPLQGDLGRLRRARRRRPSARSTTRCAGSARPAASAARAGSAASAGPGPAAPSGSRTWATSATSSAACSAVAAARRRRARRAPARGRRREPSCTCRSRTPSAA